MTSLVVSSAPLSELYRERLRETVGGQLVFTHLAEIRRQSPLRAIKRLRESSGAGCYIAIEEESSRALLPILQALGSATWPRKLWLVREDLSKSALSPIRLPLAIAATLSASAMGATASRLASAELRKLRRSPRIEIRAYQPRQMLYLNANLWFGLKVGGSVGHVAGVVNAFARRGLEVTLATAPDPVMISPSVTVVRLAPPAAVALPFELNYYSYQRRILSHLSLPVADVCYQRLSIGSYAGVLLSRRLRVPLVVEWNGSEVWAARNWGRPLRYEALALAAEDISLRHAHVVVTVSKALRDELVERGVDPERIVCHPNGVDPTIFDPERFPAAVSVALRTTYGIPERATVVAFLGTFGRWHGADVLARAIRRIADAGTEWLSQKCVRFLFVGEGLMLNDVKQILKGSPAAPFVTFTGIVPQEQAPTYLAASDIVVAPHVPNADGSPFFGSPTKLFEYLAMGRAIIASDLDQIGDVLRDGVHVGSLDGRDLNETGAATAILVPPGDVEALAHGIAFLIDHPSSRDVISKNARKLALKRYTWDHHVAAIVDGIQRARARERSS
jgi:glycosyltransferase involved in cell wall biosynthesis